MRPSPIPAALASLLLTTAAVGCQSADGPPPPTRNAEAITYPASFHAADPDRDARAKLRFSAGEVAEGQGKWDKAVENYRAAVRLVPGHQQALYRMGMVLTALRDPAAPAAWQQYVTATGGTAAAYSDLGFALDLADRPDEAAAAFKAGIATDPRCEPCRVNYARLLARRGDLDAAAAQLAAVLPPAEVQFDLGAVSEATGDKPAAAARYRRALELDPGLSDATARLAAME